MGSTICYTHHNDDLNVDKIEKKEIQAMNI